MKESGEIVSSTPFARAPYPPLRGPPSPMGKATKREHRYLRNKAFPHGESKEEAASPPKKEANPASLRSAAPSKGRGSRGRSLLPLEGGAPKGRRLDGESGMKKRGEDDRLKYVVCESTLSTAARSPFPNGEGCDMGISLFLTQSLPLGQADDTRIASAHKALRHRPYIFAAKPPPSFPRLIRAELSLVIQGQHAL